MLRRIKNRLKQSIIYRMWLVRNKAIILEDVYGIRFVLYPWDIMPIDKHISRRNYVSEFEAMRILVKPGNTVLDVGANIGLHSVLFSRWVGNTGKVYTFEPVPDTLKLLKETLALNDCTPEILQKALSDQNHTVSMQIFPKAHSVWNSLGNPIFGTIKPINSIQVDTVTLDTFCKERTIDHIDFIKIDVEGFEKFVLLGSKNLLEKGLIKVLSFEISQIPLEGSRTSAKDVFDVLHSFGYQAYTFNISTKKFSGPLTHSDSFYENYYASKLDLTRF